MVSSLIFNPVITFIKPGGLMGVLEIRSPLRADQTDPTGHAVGYAKMLTPARNWPLVAGAAGGNFASDPNVGASAQFRLPDQEHFDETYMIACGGNRTIDGFDGGGDNFLINWEKIRTAEFFEQPPGTPETEWPPLVVALYGQWNDAFVTGETFPAYTGIELRFNLLDTGTVSDLTMDGRSYINIGDVPVLVAAAPLTGCSYSAAEHGAHPDTAELLGTLEFDWATQTATFTAAP